MDRLMDWLPAHMPASARDESDDVDRARRLPPRQPDVPCHRAARHRGARLGAVHAGPSAGRLQLPLHGLAHPARDCRAGIGGLDLQSLGIPTESEYIRRYCERTGLTTPEALAPDWNFYLAYNLFRIAAILQGHRQAGRGRHRVERTSRGLGRGARPMAEMAWQFATEGLSARQRPH